MIAGEEANGTMKLLAIRPFKRHKIFLGKAYAAIAVGLMFLLIGGFVSLMTGAFLYSTASAPILVTLNASTVYAMSALSVFGIYLATLLLKIIFFAILAITISTLFRSYIGAVSISIITYFGAIIFSFITNAGWAKYVPLTNTNFFRYFGSSFIDTAGEGIETLLSPSVAIGTDIYFSGAIIVLTTLVSLALAIVVFNKKDIN